MTLKVPTAGEVQLLRSLLGQTTPADLTIKLYVNDKTPADADTSADYTEMSTHGYVPKSIVRANWTITSEAGTAEAKGPQINWLFTAAAAVNVYGYFVTGSDGTIRWAERFASPFSAEYLNDAITITPRFTLNSVA